MRKKIEPADFAAFERDGYLILPGYFSAAEINSMIAATEDALRQRPMEVVADSLITGERIFWGLSQHRESGRFKLNDLYLWVDEIRAMALESGLVELLRALLAGRRPTLSFTLNLTTGTGQQMHIDSLYMTPRTPHHLVASWIALEDVDPAAGPLEYYPGSNHIPLYRFRDGSHTSNAAEAADWSSYIAREIESRGLKKETFLARQGDVFLWHSDLVHGGGAVHDKSKTRRSLVCHYFTEEDTRDYCQFFPDWQIKEFNGACWIDRLPQAVVGANPKRFDADHPFPEQTYLRRHPDLALALKEARITSGFDHYIAHGYSEGRAI